MLIGKFYLQKHINSQSLYLICLTKLLGKYCKPTRTPWCIKGGPKAQLDIMNMKNRENTYHIQLEIEEDIVDQQNIQLFCNRSIINKSVIQDFVFVILHITDCSSQYHKLDSAQLVIFSIKVSIYFKEKTRLFKDPIHRNQRDQQVVSEPLGNL